MKLTKNIGRAALPVILALSGPIFAQEVDIHEVDPEEMDIIVTTSAVMKKTPWFFEAELAPSFSRNALASRGDRLSDLKSASSATLGYEGYFIPKRLRYVVKAGAKWESDFEWGDDDPDTSALYLGAKLNLERTKQRRRISPFISYQVDFGRQDFFGAFDYTDHAFSLGSDIILGCKQDGNKCTDSWPGKFKISPSLDRIYSRDETRERTTPRLRGSYDLALENRLRIRLEGDFQWRRFDHVDDGGNNLPTRRQRRFIGAASVNFAKMIDENSRLLDTLSLGMRYSYADERGEKDDMSLAEFLPSIKLKLIW